MATNLVRFDKDGAAKWGVVDGAGVSPLEGDYPTTAALIERGEVDWLAAKKRAPATSLDNISILSPVTAPCRIYCQGANYRQHMIDSGMNPDAKIFNMFFTKSDVSIASAQGAVMRPKHVALLDYEIELALVFRRAIDKPVAVTSERLKDYVFGIAVANDLSARDVQLSQTQFFKGKSYRGFCPLGPWLTVLEDDEFNLIEGLELNLSVNGATRQRDSTRNLVFKPAETVSELSTFANIAPGDVLLTGTPRGCALPVPPPAIRRILQLLPERQFWKLFLKSQSRQPQYLQPGDRISARIASRGRPSRSRRAADRGPRRSVMQSLGKPRPARTSEKRSDRGALVACLGGAVGPLFHGRRAECALRMSESRAHIDAASRFPTPIAVRMHRTASVRSTSWSRPSPIAVMT